MNKVKIIFWITTILVLVVCLITGITNIVGSEALDEANKPLRLPGYLSPFLGFAKILGGVAIAFPFFKRFHQAAYHGLIFYFIGATYVLLASGGGPDKYGITLFILLLTVISYIYSMKLNSESVKTV